MHHFVSAETLNTTSLFIRDVARLLGLAKHRQHVVRIPPSGR